MKADVLAMDTSSRLEDSSWAERLSRLPADMRPALERYHRWQDRQNALAARFLLLQGLRERNLGMTDLLNLQRTETGKPFLKKGPAFNISHTDGLTLCAFVDTGDVGIDVERVRPVPFDDFATVFSTIEWQQIHASPQPMRTFFEFWTMKESVMKLDGRGLQLDPLCINIRDGNACLDNTPLFTQALPLEQGFTGWMATQHRVSSLSYRSVTLGDWTL